MRGLSLFAGLAVAVLGATVVQAAALLNFDFSFTDNGDFSPDNVPGTVTGEIIGLADNAFSSAESVIINSFPAGLEETFSPPLNTTGGPFANSFEVSAGQVVAAKYTASGADWVLYLNDFGQNTLSGPTSLVTGNASSFSGISFTPAAVPELSVWAAMLIGFAGIGALAWRRNRDSIYGPVARSRTETPG
jgi:hypothetical protein